MKVSIITVAYNSAATIRDTIESVLSQDYPDIEYILIDGNSQDETLEIAQEYKEQISQIVSEPDQGIYDAMNKGIRLATGDIVGILNSDDFFSAPTIISSVVKAFQNKQTDAVYGDVRFVDPGNLLRCVRYYSSAIFRPWLLRLGLMPAHPSFYVRREIYNRYGLYSTDYKIAADFELLFRFIYIHKIKIYYLYLDFVTMRTGGASTESLKARQHILREQLNVFKKYHVYANSFILSLRYIYKIGEILYTRFLFNSPLYNSQILKK